MERAFVDPEKERYFLHKGRYTTTRKFFGKNWLRSHLVWTWANQVSLEILQRFLERGYNIHHKNGIVTDDSVENLMIMRKCIHTSLHQSNKILSPETRRKISAANKGNIPTSETRKKISEAKKGEKNYMWGKTHTSEARQKISEANKGKKAFFRTSQKTK